MNPIGPPTRAYDAPPTGQLPAACPRCGCALQQFLQQPGPPPPPPMPPLAVLLAGAAPQPPPPPLSVATAAPVPLPRFTAVNNPAPALTVFVILHGPHAVRHQQLLATLTDTAGLGQVELRMLCSEVGEAALAAARELVPADCLQVGTQPKFPTLRAAWRDPAQPLRSPWLVVLDDTVTLKRADWLTALTQTIAEQPPEVAAIGNKFAHALTLSPRHNPRDWFQLGSWFRHVAFRTVHGDEAPNGNYIHYVSPNFFALRVAAIPACDLPDARLAHSGGGIVLGEQLHQNGYQLKSFNADGRYAHEALTPSREAYPWLA